MIPHDVMLLLREIEQGEFLGSPISISDTPVRRQAKRLGLIKSSPRNAGMARNTAGQAYRWRLTDAGREAMKEVG